MGYGSDRAYQALGNVGLSTKAESANQSANAPSNTRGHRRTDRDCPTSAERYRPPSLGRGGWSSSRRGPLVRLGKLPGWPHFLEGRGQVFEKPVFETVRGEPSWGPFAVDECGWLWTPVESEAFRSGTCGRLWTAVDGAWRSTDQKVGSSSLSGRARYPCVSGGFLLEPRSLPGSVGRSLQPNSSLGARFVFCSGVVGLGALLTR
jgi:hypothetical protein